MQMDGATQQNAALVEQTTAAAESMRAQADGLTVLVSRFKLDERKLTQAAGRTTRSSALAAIRVPPVARRARDQKALSARSVRGWSQ